MADEFVRRRKRAGTNTFDRDEIPETPPQRLQGKENPETPTTDEADEEEYRNLNRYRPGLGGNVASPELGGEVWRRRKEAALATTTPNTNTLPSAAKSAYTTSATPASATPASPSIPSSATLAASSSPSATTNTKSKSPTTDSTSTRMQTPHPKKGYLLGMQSGKESPMGKDPPSSPSDGKGRKGG